MFGYHLLAHPKRSKVIQSTMKKSPTNALLRDVTPLSVSLAQMTHHASATYTMPLVFLQFFEANKSPRHEKYCNEHQGLDESLQVTDPRCNQYML